MFGSENGDLNQLRTCAEILDDEETKIRIKNNLAQGVNYAKALSLACESDILNSPNNVLAVEYLRAAKRIGSKTQPVTLLRENNIGSAPQNYASSTALRENESLRKKYTFDYVIPDICLINDAYKKFSTAFIAEMSAKEISEIADVTEGLENRIFAADKTQGYEKMIEEIKTKRYTRAKLQRIALNCVLGITKDIQAAAIAGLPKINVLGVAKKSAQMLEGIVSSTDEITDRADRLFAALSGEKTKKGLVVL